jgi:hypothetical protein
VKAHLLATQPQELMLVTNTKGQLCHISESLAQLLGRSRQQLMSLPTSYAIEQLMVKPFGQAHRPHLAGPMPTACPLYSCRSGLSVLMQSSNPSGAAEIKPFNLTISHKTVSDQMHYVAIFQERTMQQALDERRLRVKVDHKGFVVNVMSRTPTALFGFNPGTLVGMHVGAIVDVLQPPGTCCLLLSCKAAAEVTVCSMKNPPHMHH